MNQTQRDAIKQTCIDQYPNFFDDKSNESKLSDLIIEADMVNAKYANRTKDDEYRLIVTKYLLAELYEVDNQDGDLSGFKMDIFQTNMNPNNQTNVYWQQYQRLLSALGLSKWRVHLA